MEINSEQKENLIDGNNNFMYFENTINMNKNKNSEYIQYITKNNKSIGRLFLDLNKKEKYIELFSNQTMNVLDISNKITFLHSYSNIEQNHYKENKFIGFRYYENGPLGTGKFFTIIMNNFSNYFILEKNKTIKDLKNESFYDEDLDCYDIIKKIIFDKYKNRNIGGCGDVFAELLGYSYALTSLGKYKKLMFVEPIIANLKNKNKYIIKDSIQENIYDDSIYVEPFIYDGHVSLIIASIYKNERYNIIFDMSQYHFSEQRPNFIFLPNSLRKNNVIYPKYSIQNYSSCCLWLYGEIECLMKNDKYSSFSEIINILNEEIIFSVDVINLLSNEIEGINSLIKLEKNICKNAENIDFDRFLIYDMKGFISLHKDIIYSKFLDIDCFLNKNYNLTYNYDRIFICDCQQIIMEIYGLKNRLLLNLKYNNLLPQNNDILLSKQKIENFLSIIDNIIEAFRSNYNCAFYSNNLFFYGNKFKNLLDKIKIPFTFDLNYKNKIKAFKNEKFLENIESDYSKNKEQIDRDIRLLSEETISRELNSLNEICFNVMNK